MPTEFDQWINARFRVFSCQIRYSELLPGELFLKDLTGDVKNPIYIKISPTDHLKLGENEMIVEVRDFYVRQVKLLIN